MLCPDLPSHITEESVDKSVERRSQVLRSNGALARIGELIQEAENILRNPTPRGLSNSVRLVEEVSKAVGPSTICRSGCSHCCHMAVMITGREAREIEKSYGINRCSPVPRISKDSVVNTFMGSPCPFLEDSKCSIYPVRPLACRGYFNLSDFPEVCDVVNYPGSDVPSFDLTPIWAVTSLRSIKENDTIADIRDFFPEGHDTIQSL